MSDIIVNKVIKGDETYLDLTNDTVSEGALLKNRTAHNSEGIQIQGTMEDGGGSVTGVKGDDESVYRDGNVNITAANVGTYTASQIDTLLNEKVDVHGTDSLMTNAEHVKLAGIEAGAEENVIESISLNGEEITPVNKAVALSVIDKDVNDLTNYYKKSETDASLGAKQNIILSSTLSIGGQTVTEVEEALGSLAGISKSMTGATSSAAGEGGFVPSPSAGDENKALFGDGTWKPVSGGGGHAILDEDGVTYPQRSKLQFEGCEVTDDSTNGITKIKAEGGVTGVKGNAETDYRTGNVNLTPAHVGAVDEVEYEEDIYGVNLGVPFYGYTLVGNNEEGHCLYVGGTNSMTILAKVEDGKSYIASKSASVGNRFRLVGFYDYPPIGAQKPHNSSIIVLDNSIHEYQFVNTQGFKYVTLTTNYDNAVDDYEAIQSMLRKATIQDDTYRPFNQQSIQNQLSEQTNVLGAKNLLKITTDTKTNQGVTYTFHRDSKGNVTKIVPTGTATAHSFCVIWNRLDDEPLKGLEKGKEYILSGDYGLGAGNGYVYVNFYTGATRIGGVNADGTGETKFTIPNEVDYLDFGVGILNGKTAPTGFAFYPMVTPASVHDRTYVPYAMTNRELTEVKVSEITSIISNNNYSKGTLKCWYKKIGKLVELFIQIKCIATTDTWINILDYNTIPKPALVGNYPIYSDIPASGGTTQYPLVVVFNSSNLQVRKGTPEYYYHLHTTYISE